MAHDDLAAPYELPGDRGAVLCLHGFSNTPYEMRPVAEALAARGFHVHAPAVAGHATRPEDLAHTRWSDWLQSARRAFAALAERHDRVALVGLSMGGLLSLTLAHENGERVAGAVVMGVPLEFEWRTQQLFRLVRKMPFADALPFVHKALGPDISDPAAAAAAPGYDRIPPVAAASLLDGQDAVLACVDRIGVPVLVQHGRHDHVAPLRAAHRLYRLLRTPRRRLVVYPRSWHILPLDVEHEAVVDDAVAFVESLFPPRQETR
ncbi:MAG: alpha/beta fold hydrolase [Myxococcales bacterium]|nr:alpha/beta fold hydrolase [Myxococcales bacterium]